MKEAKIAIQAGDFANVFIVTVSDDRSETTHAVILSDDILAEKEGSTPKEIVFASFQFLLDREAKESILAEFSLNQIEEYFPEYREKLQIYIDKIKK